MIRDVLATQAKEQAIKCPACNSAMAAVQTERGAFYVCGYCRSEIPITERGVVEE